MDQSSWGGVVLVLGCGLSVQAYETYDPYKWHSLYKPCSYLLQVKVSNPTLEESRSMLVAGTGMGSADTSLRGKYLQAE